MVKPAHPPRLRYNPMNRTAVLILGSGILILAGLAMLLRPAPPTTTTAAPGADAQPAATPVRAEAEPRSFDIVVRQGRRVSGPELIQVHVGENLILRVTSDQDDELHLHGYDLHLQLRAGEPGALAFQAQHSGHFDYELHHAGLELGALEVLPQ